MTFPKLWDQSLYLMESWVGLGAEYAVTRSLVFMMLAEGYSTLIHIPFELYSTFVIEERFGFNKQTLLVKQLKLASSLTAANYLPLVIFHRFD